MKEDLKKRKVNGQEAGQGRMWVRAHYVDANGEHIIEDKESWLKTKIFEEGEEVRTAWVDIKKTIQIRQYEPLVISMGCSLPARAEEMRGALQEALDNIKAEFVPAFNEVEKAVKGKR